MVTSHGKTHSIADCAVLSIVFTYFFFIEYLPPFSRVHVPYDLEGYHFSLVDFAFHRCAKDASRNGTGHSTAGISFVGNTQAGCSTPMWLVLAANVGRKSLSYQSLQSMVFAHVWLAFFLCYRWLRYKAAGGVGECYGAGVFAYSGTCCYNSSTSDW